MIYATHIQHMKRHNDDHQSNSIVSAVVTKQRLTEHELAIITNIQRIPVNTIYYRGVSEKDSDCEITLFSGTRTRKYRCIKRIVSTLTCFSDTTELDVGRDMRMSAYEILLGIAHADSNIGPSIKHAPIPLLIETLRIMGGNMMNEDAIMTVLCSMDSSRFTINDMMELHEIGELIDRMYDDAIIAIYLKIVDVIVSGNVMYYIRNMADDGLIRITQNYQMLCCLLDANSKMADDDMRKLDMCDVFWLITMIHDSIEQDQISSLIRKYLSIDLVNDAYFHDIIGSVAANKSGTIIDVWIDHSLYRTPNHNTYTHYIHITPIDMNFRVACMISGRPLTIESKWCITDEDSTIITLRHSPEQHGSCTSGTKIRLVSVTPTQDIVVYDRVLYIDNSNRIRVDASVLISPIVMEVTYMSDVKHGYV